MMRLLERLVAASLALAMWLALPLALLLFAQWPLRDVIQAGSRQANDAAQWIFALYVSAALTAATRQGTHLATHAAQSPAARRAAALIGALIALAWSAAVLWMSAPMVWQSVAQLERFPDTLNPGYFLVKLAVAWLALLVLLQSALQLARGGAQGGGA
jgi:TRAP-type C4-dicarboxylate transport system permease small subunit